MTGRSKLTIGWTALIVGTALVWIVAFSVMEWHGLTHDDSITLSRYLWNIAMAWPPIVFIAGDVFGFLRGMLITHLFWRWDPTDTKDHRG